MFGAGGHARVAIDVLRAAGEDIRACLAPIAGGFISGVPIWEELGTLTALAGAEQRVFIAIGKNSLRRQIAQDARNRGFEVISAISPRAYLAPDVAVASGVLVVHGAIVNSLAVLSDDVIVNSGATVDHDNFIAEGAHVSPGCHLAGNVVVGKETFIGIGSAIIPGITIGNGTLIGAGSVVIRDIGHGRRAWGNPAKDHGAN